MLGKELEKLRKKTHTAKGMNDFFRILNKEEEIIQEIRAIENLEI